MKTYNISTPYVASAEPLLREIAGRKGLEADTDNPEKEFPYFNLNPERRNQLLATYDDGEGIITLGEFITLLESLPDAKKDVLIDYDLTIKKDGIHAGCQIISFEKFAVLVEAVSNYNK